MNEKMMTLTFFKLYTVYIKKLGQFFSHALLAIHLSVGSYKYFEKLISKVKEHVLGFLKILCTCA